MQKVSFVRYAVSVVLLSTMVITGCSFSYSSRSSSSGGDDDNTTIVHAAPNYPEQLLQLNEAHDKKLISDEDYQKQLKKIQKAMNK